MNFVGMNDEEARARGLEIGHIRLFREMRAISKSIFNIEKSIEILAVTAATALFCTLGMTTINICLYANLYISRSTKWGNHTSNVTDPS
jgi:hypothetical protein